MVTDTSREAYKQVKDSGTEKSQARKVLDALRSMDYLPTANELNEEELDLDIPNGRVHARLNKLVDKGKVLEVAERKDQYSGREAKVWMPKKKKEVNKN